MPSVQRLNYELSIPAMNSVCNRDYSISNLQFTELIQHEMKQDCISDFSITSQDYYVAILGSSIEFCTLELTPMISYLVKFPYNWVNYEVPKERPLNKLLRNVRFPDIYANCNVLDSQEFALDPVYVDECSVQHTDAKLTHVDWSPYNLPNGQPLMAVLTNFGAFYLLTKEPNNSCWNFELMNLSHIIQTDVVPPSGLIKRKLVNFDDLKYYFNRYWVTAFVWQRWHTTNVTTKTNVHTLIAATAQGHILIMKFNDSAAILIQHSCTDTDMDRISRLLALDNLILVCNVTGQVKMYKINGMYVEPVCYLWSKNDRMGVINANLNYCPVTQRYMVVISKAAHVLTFCLNTSGEVLSSAHNYLGGLRVSGIIMLTPTEYILTTINSVIYYLQIGNILPDAQPLEISVRTVNSNFDTINYQIVGVATTIHKNLYIFLLYRNREYFRHHSIFTRHSTLLSICKLNMVDSLQELTKMPIINIFDYVDYLTAIRLDIVNELETEKYINFCKLTDMTLPTDEVTDDFLQKLQLKNLCLVTLQQVYQDKQNKSNVPDLFQYDTTFLSIAIQITHILLRLQYLYNCKQTLTTFQQSAAKYLQQYFTKLQLKLQQELMAEQNIKGTLLEQIFTNFHNLANTVMDGLKKLPIQMDATVEIVETNVNVRYCSISYMPLESTLYNRYCMLCGRQALQNAELLGQLFMEQEIIKCTFCRAILQTDENII